VLKIAADLVYGAPDWQSPDHYQPRCTVRRKRRRAGIFFH
jgi:hypothetical protein